MIKRLPILFVCMAFLSCTNDIREVMSIPQNKLHASQIGDSVTMLYTDSAHLKLMVKANRMLVFDKNVSEPFTVLPKGVFVTFFDENEKVAVTMRADFGVRYDVSRTMRARNNVVVVNRSGEKLETEKLIWNENTKKIHTDEFVKITRGNEIVTGKGMESNQDFTQYELKKVTGTIQLKDP